MLDICCSFYYFCTMKIAQKIKYKINSFKEGEIFTYKQLSINKNEYQSASKAIERIINIGIIKRVSPGVFYKPKQSIFGELKPDNKEILKPYLFKDGKRVAYITGTLLYNKLGLTTQIPQTIKIASRDKEIKVKKSNIKIISAKSYVEVTKFNFQYLEILDVFKNFKKIPDLDIKSGITILSTILKKFNAKEISTIIKIALKYPPRTRALLGALLEMNNIQEDLNKLQESLNPFSEYFFGIKKEILPTIDNWKIK